jgi:hypothetical protein
MTCSRASGVAREVPCKANVKFFFSVVIVYKLSGVFFQALMESLSSLSSNAGSATNFLKLNCP